MVKKSVAKALAVKKRIRKHHKIKRLMNFVFTMEVHHNDLAAWKNLRGWIQKYNPELLPEEHQTRNTP